MVAIPPMPNSSDLSLPLAQLITSTRGPRSLPVTLTDAAILLGARNLTSGGLVDAVIPA
jgi:hypothetical protein